LLPSIVTGTWPIAKVEQVLATLPQFPIPVEVQSPAAYISFVNGEPGVAMKNSLGVTLADAERWEWYAAGDKAVAPRATPRPWTNNGPEQIVWEMGLAVAVPLLLATIASLVLA
jgi:hypothetical protein